MLIERARRGLTVVRLKGGDPFIFGRGGEEMEALAAAGIPFEIVPGVTTPLGIAAYTGVPLTHREHTSAVTFVTGHNVEAIDWSKIGASETLVLFMGLVNFPAIAREMIAHGRSPRDAGDGGALGHASGSGDARRERSATLPRRIEQAGLKPPATIVIGEVVALRERFNWFEKLPLFGQRIVVTRDRRQAADAGGAAGSAGRRDAVRAGDRDRSRRGIRAARSRDRESRCLRLADFHQRQRRAAFRRSAGSLGSRSAVSASASSAPSVRRRARRSRRCICKVDVMPKEYVAESLLEALAGDDLQGKRILLPRAAVARDLVPVELRERGAMVDVVEAYRTVIPADAAARAQEALAHKPDWITFTSSSTVKNLLAVTGREALGGNQDRLDWSGDVGDGARGWA